MSSNYSITRDQIIITALRKLGAVEPQDTASTIDANIVTNCAQALNLMVKQWMTEGIKLWTVTEINFPLVLNQTSYTAGPSLCDITTDKPLRIIQAWVRNTVVTPDIDIPLNIISRQEYNMLGSKFSTGTANSIYLNPGVTTSTIKLFLTPDASAVATYTVYMVVQRPINDISSASSIPDFPNEWMQALVWGLADQLALEYGLPVNHRQEVLLKAEKYRDLLMEWDIENESTFFTPDIRSAIRYGR